MTSTDRNVGELKAALDHAFVVAFDHSDPGLAIDRMKQVFLSSAYPDTGAQAEPADREQTVRFLTALLDSLEAVRPQITGLVHAEYDKMLNKRDEQRCRILVPQSRLLFGVCDAWDVLKEGECLYIPVGWWHYVRGLKAGISVSFWWG